VEYYYVNSQNQAVGPIDRAELMRLEREGAISQKTLVAPVGSSNWMTYEKALTHPEGAIPPVPKGFAHPPLPVGVMLMAIANLVLSSLFCLCIPLSVLGLVVLSVNEKKLAETPYPLWFIYLSVCNFSIRCLLCFTSGLGLLLRQEWGRFAALFYCGSVFLFVGVEAVLTSVFIVPIVRQITMNGVEALPHAANDIGGYIGGLIGGLISIFYAGLFLYLVTRPDCKSAMK